MLVSDVDNGGKTVTREMALPPSQFCCKPRTARRPFYKTNNNKTNLVMGLVKVQL